MLKMFFLFFAVLQQRNRRALRKGICIVYIIYWRITLKAERRKKDGMDKLNTII